MENKREELLKKLAEKNEGTKRDRKLPTPKMRTKVSYDRMQVHFFLELPVEWDEESYELTAPEIAAFLAKKRITYGILSRDIEEYCKHREFREELLVAEGTPPIPGEDGSYTLQIESGAAGKPKALEDGRVDYRQLDLIQNVEVGELLCTIVHPTAGIPGCDVFGKSVPASRGVEAPVQAGKNVEEIPGEEDGVTLLTAGTAGRVEFKRGCMLIETIYLVNGDVGPKTGHISFQGSVKVVGNVLEGFNITADQDIHISGRVEGCLISAGGNVVVEDGVTGMDKAVIYVKGNFTSRFLENASVVCGGDVSCDIALRSNIKARGIVCMEGQRGALVGGECLSGEEIVVRTLGSQRNLMQNVMVYRGWDKMDEFKDDFFTEAPKIDMQQSLQILNTLKERLKRCKADIETTRELILSGDFTGIGKMKKLMDLKVQLEGEVNEVRYEMRHGNTSAEEYKAEKKKENSGKRQARITCRGTVYPGVRITIEHEALAVADEMKYCFFIKDSEGIYVGQL